MNTYRIISRVLVGTVIVFVGGVSAMDKEPVPGLSWTQFTQQKVTSFDKTFKDNKGIVVATAFAAYKCGKKDHKKRVAIHTIGHLYDNVLPILLKKDWTYQELLWQSGIAVVYGGGNYALLESEDYFGMEKKIEKVEDTVSDKISSYVAPVVGLVLRVASHPQVALFAIGSLISPYINKA